MGSSDSPADNYMGFNQYSMMLQQQGKFTEAIAVNRKYQGKLHASIAAFLDATDYYLTVQLYLILGDTAGAMNVIRDGREFLQADYSNISNSKMFEAELILAEGMVSIKSGDLQKADQCITALEKLSYLSALPAIGRYRTLLIACVESTTGDHREAIATLEQLDPHVSRLPDAPMYLYPLAVNYYLDENLDKARELFANLANNSYMKFYHPYESIMGLYWLGRIHQDMSNPEQAGKYFAAFLSHWKEADDKLPEVKDARLRLRNLMASLPGDKLLQRSPTAHSETFRR
jgi:tetratricopeptide (TPR) repeat protein